MKGNLKRPDFRELMNPLLRTTAGILFFSRNRYFPQVHFLVYYEHYLIADLHYTLFSFHSILPLETFTNPFHDLLSYDIGAQIDCKAYCHYDISGYVMIQRYKITRICDTYIE
jgi:hypothetical protein